MTMRRDSYQEDKKIMHKKYIISIIALSFLTIFLLLPQGVFAEGVLIITNSSVAPGIVDAEMVKNIYGGHLTKWPDNSKATLTVIETHPVHEEFLKTYMRKSESQFTSTWKKIMFTGKGRYPTRFDSVDQLIDFVSKTQGAIGYVPADANPQGVSIQK